MSEKIKILYITHVSSLFGANRSMVDLLEALDRDRYEPYVIFPFKGPLEGRLKEGNIKFKKVKFYLSVHEGSDNTCYKFGGNREALREIGSLIKKWDIDIIHSNASVFNIGAIAAFFYNKKHIWHVRETEEHYKYKRDMKYLDQLLFWMADRVIYISEYAYSQRLNKKLLREKAIILKDGIGINHLLYKRTSYLKKDQLNIIAPGLISPPKGQIQIVEAMNILKQKNIDAFTLKIVGDGCREYINRIKKLVHIYELEDRVEILPFMDDLFELRKASDISITSSENEALGRVTIEAMYSELLVIGADSGATSKLLDNGKNGLIYGYGHPEELARQLEHILNHRNECAEKIINAKQYAINHFSMDKYIKKIEKIYSSLV